MAGASPGNMNPTNKRFSFHDPGESNTEDGVGGGCDLNTPVTTTTSRAINDTWQKDQPKTLGTEGQGPNTRNPTGWYHMPSLEADWA